MKKKIIAFVILVFAIITGVIGIGCSKAQCTYDCYDKCGGCANCAYDKVGDYFNCFREHNCIPSCVFHSDCYKEFCIDPWYTCGNTCQSNCQDKAIGKILDDLDKIDANDYYYSTKPQINNSDSTYFNVIVSVNFSAKVDLKNVVLRVFVESGANSTNFVVFVGNLKAGKSYSHTENVTFAKTNSNTIGAVDVNLVAYGE